MPKSASACNSLLNLYYRAEAWADIAENDSTSPATVIQIPLANASYTDTSTLASNEGGYTNYARQTLPRSGSGWTLATTKSTTNAAAVDYPAGGVTGATMVAAATGVGAGAGIPMHYGDLNAPIAVSNAIQPRFAIGAITISEA